ncbi:MAG: hypothetical protein R2932_35760 [Caldilineaceae bacterium]
MAASAPSVVPGKSPAKPVDPKLQMRKETNLWRDAWQRLRRNKLAIVGMIIVVTFLLLAIFADLIAP